MTSPLQIHWLLTSIVILTLCACASVPVKHLPAEAPIQVGGPPYRLSVQVVDDLGKAARGTFIRVMECCHTEAGPCGRVPVDDHGKVSIHVCPVEDGVVRITLTPDPKNYRVPPISEFEVRSDSSVSVTVTRHEKVLQHLIDD